MSIEKLEAIKQRKKDYYIRHRDEILQKSKKHYYNSKKPLAKVESLEGEIWKFPFDGYHMVSNYGRCKSIEHIDNSGHIQGEKLKKCYHKKNGYVLTNIKGKSYKLSILVAMAFPDICGKWFEGCEVHHIDHNPSNNKPDNLIVLSQKEHRELHSNSDETYCKRSCAQLKSWLNRSHIGKMRKPVIAYKGGKIIGVFDSEKEASKTLNISASKICSMIKNRNEYMGYSVSFSDEINNMIDVEKR